MKYDLRGQWNFKQADGDETMTAVVPSTNYQDLLALGKIPDPFVKTNEKDVFWVAEKDWIYSKSFTVPQDVLKGDRIYLCADRVDTVADVKLNGVLLGRCIDCHISYRIDITGKLSDGENTLEFYFHSPVEYVKERYATVKTPFNANGMNGVAHIRKPQCHFGWDWGPVLPVSGISGDIFIESLRTAEITDFTVTQQHHYNGSVTLSLACTADVFNDSAVSCEYAVYCPDGNVLTATGLMKSGVFNAEIEIEKAELWWTRELSGKDKQPLYGVMAAIVSNGEIVAEKSLNVGLRTIKLDTSIDDFGKNFCFVLNGVKVFAKGANFIPPDSMINRFTAADYDKLLDAAEFSNMNMLRVWGGGYIGDEVLYDKCDRRGILLWQDFPFACQAYPFFMDDFLELVDVETDNIVKRLRHHASLALWCGNNEIEQITPAWFYMRRYVGWTDDYFHAALPWKIHLLDPERDYIPGSPCGLDFMLGVNADTVGDTHLWAVWHGLQPLNYYRKRLTRFCSEYGFESLPDKKTLLTFADEDDMSMKSGVMRAHQKCGDGNDKIKYYVASRFRLPEKFDDYIYLSQVCQSECVRDAAEHWRRHKGQCNGALYWQLNDCWPVCSWSSVDYCGRYKALQYTSRRFFSPVTVSIEDSDGGFYVYTFNDSQNDVSAHLDFKVCNYDGKVLLTREKDVTLIAGESKNQLGAGMASVRMQNKRLRAYAVATLTSDGEIIGRSTVLLRKEKHAKLEKPVITKSYEFIGDGILQITLLSDKYARFVRLDNAVSDAPFSDNWFDLLPGEAKTVTQNLGKVCPSAILEQAVSVFSATDLSVHGNAFTDFFIRAKVLLKPKNFVSFLYMRHIPKKPGRRFLKSYSAAMEEYNKDIAKEK